MFSGLIFVHHFIAIFGVRYNDPVCMYECGLVQCVYMHVYVCVCVFVQCIYSVCVCMLCTYVCMYVCTRVCGLVQYMTRMCVSIYVCEAIYPPNRSVCQDFSYTNSNVSKNYCHNLPTQKSAIHYCFVTSFLIFVHVT